VDCEGAWGVTEGAACDATCSQGATETILVDGETYTVTKKRKNKGKKCNNGVIVDANGADVTPIYYTDGQTRGRACPGVTESVPGTACPAAA